MTPCIEPPKGLIIHSGAIGDCLLTLPLAAFMKQGCGLGQIDFLGRPEAVGFYPHRSAVDHVRSIDALPLHRLFEPQTDFCLEDPDRLVTAFKGYEQIVSFLGAGHPDFEQNLLMTVHASHSAEVTILPMAPAADEPVSGFYIRRFAEETGRESADSDLSAAWLVPTPSDLAAGQERFEQMGIDADAAIAVLQPGSGGRHKCWHPRNFRDLANALRSGGMVPVFLFGPVEQERLSAADKQALAETAAVLSELTLTETLQALSAADLFIGNDSGISHLAGCLGKKTVAIFGPTNPAIYRPLGPRVTVFKADSKGFQAPCPDDVAALYSRIEW